MSLTTEKQIAIDELEELLTDMRTKEQNADLEFAQRLIAIFEKWILKSKIVYQSGLMAGQNAVTGTFTGKLE